MPFVNAVLHCSAAFSDIFVLTKKKLKFWKINKAQPHISANMKCYWQHNPPPNLPPGHLAFLISVFFNLNTKRQWWHIKTVKLNLVARPRISLKTAVITHRTVRTVKYVAWSGSSLFQAHLGTYVQELRIAIKNLLQYNTLVPQPKYWHMPLHDRLAFNIQYVWSTFGLQCKAATDLWAKFGLPCS